MMKQLFILDEVQLLQLFANDYFFFTVIALLFFVSGFFAGRAFTQHKHQDYFDHCFESNRILGDELRKLRKQLSESEQKQ